MICDIRYMYDSNMMLETNGTFAILQQLGSGFPVGRTRGGRPLDKCVFTLYFHSCLLYLCMSYYPTAPLP